MAEDPDGKRARIRYSVPARAFTRRPQKVVSEKPDQWFMVIMALVWLLLGAASVMVGLCVGAVVCAFAPLWMVIASGIVTAAVTGAVLSQTLRGEVLGVIAVLLLVLVMSSFVLPTINKLRAHMHRSQVRNHQHAKANSTV